jgi:hypothetical protein
MKFNKWTVGLAAVGVVSLASAARADEQMSQVQTALTQTTLSGYVDTAMQWNPNSDTRNGGGPNIPGYSFAKDDGFQLNAVDIALDKPEDSSAWAAGYHVEVMGGPDSIGLYDNHGQAALRQAFIRLHTPVGGNGIDWQIGVWDSIIGYESNSDPANPNYTRSYGYTIEPTTFTGILGTYKVNDEISISGGIADDDGGIDLAGNAPTATGNTSAESLKTYMGSVALTAPASFGFLNGATLSGGVVHSSDARSVIGGGNNTSLYVGTTVPTPVSMLKVGASFDYLFESDLATPKGDNDAWDVAGYATVQATDKLSFDARAEYYDGHNANAADDVGLYAGTDAEEITGTIQYNLWANVISRAEVRWDHTENNKPFGASKTGAPDRNNDFLFALNFIYQF